MIKTVFKLILASLFLVAMAPTMLMAGSPVAYGNVRVLSADAFESDGVEISGWNWLRDDGYANYGKWEFSGFPYMTSDGFIYLHFNCLVTDKPSGGSGYSTSMEVCLLSDSGLCFPVYLENTHSEFRTPEDTEGWGYSATGTLGLHDGFSVYFLLFQQVSLYIKRFGPNTENIAVNENSITIEWR